MEIKRYLLKSPKTPILGYTTLLCSTGTVVWRGMLEDDRDINELSNFHNKFSRRIQRIFWPVYWLIDLFIDWLIDYIVFYAVSAIFRPYNGGQPKSLTKTYIREEILKHAYNYLKKRPRWRWNGHVLTCRAPTDNNTWLRGHKSETVSLLWPRGQWPFSQKF